MGEYEQGIVRLYIDGKTPMYKIAKKYRIDPSKVKNILIRNNVEMRKQGSWTIKPEIKFTAEQYEFFDGLIAGDGCIPNSKNRNKNISCNLKYENFGRYIFGCLGLSFYSKKCIHIDDRYKNGYCETYNFYHGNNILFTKEHQRWYPNNKKTIPDDFRFSANSMNMLYLCDGTRTSHSSRKGIVLCTNDFEKENLENTLVKYLCDIDIKCWVNRINQIYIPVAMAPRFLEYIGSCPIECYQHKWDLGEKKIIGYNFSKETIKSLYVDENLSALEIAHKLKVSKTTVLNYLRKYDLYVYNFSFDMPSESELEKLYIKEKKSSSKIAKILGISQSSVLKYLRKYKLPVRKSCGPRSI